MSTRNPIKSKRVPRFVEEYAKDRNGTQAAIRAGWPPSWAHVAASELLKEPKVQEMLAEHLERISREALYTAVDLLRDWVEVACVDASRIVKTRRLNCRHCWGINHAYQWGAREYAEACDKALQDAETLKREPQMPSCDGGFGWRHNEEPNLECPECAGEGVEDVYIADFDTLTAAERKLIAGVKRTKDGIEVKLKDQEAVRARIAQHLGMLIERKELTGKDGRPLLPAVPADLPTDPQALAALYGQVTNGI